METNEPRSSFVNSSSSVVEQPKQRGMKIAAVSLIVLVVVIGFGFIVWQMKSAQPNKSQEGAAGVLVNPNQSTSTDSQTAALDQGAVGEPSIDPFMDQGCKNRLPVVAGKSGAVTWQNPERLTNLHIFTPLDAPDTSYWQDVNYKVGTINSGKYAGGEFILTFVIPDGPWPGLVYRIIRLKDKLYFLNKYSSDYPEFITDTQFINKPIQDKIYTLTDLEFPETLQTTSPAADFIYAKSLGFFQNGTEFFCADNLTKVFSDPAVGDVYTDLDPKTLIENQTDDQETIQAGQSLSDYTPYYGFYVKAVDGTKRVYALEIPFIGPDKIPLLNWTDSQKNAAEFSHQAIGGCGASRFLDVENVQESDLTQIGTTFSGHEVYGYKDPKAAELQDLYINMYVAEGKTKPSFTAFLNSHPLFFWKNQFGYFVRFKNQAYQPLAECGKPVIYLYPEKTTSVKVQVSPLGGMSYSDPDYGQGWSVVAHPTGKITNLRDNKEYPYLFWEGRGDLYIPPSRGFMVERNNLDQFLTEKLSAFGLNFTEIKDFKEYWLPKMQAKPFYFVTFMTNDIMDAIAPLDIQPKPDTVIRVLMDFIPLDKPVPVKGFRITTPARKGFTVVEWGGVLR